MKTQFRDLSVPLKLAVICAWVFGLVTILEFTIGFIVGFLGL